MAGISSSIRGSLDVDVLNASGTAGGDIAKEFSSIQTRKIQFQKLYEDMKEQYANLSEGYEDCKKTLDKSTEENRLMQEKFRNLLDKLQMENRKKQSQIEEMKTQVIKTHLDL